MIDDRRPDAESPARRPPGDAGGSEDDVAGDEQRPSARAGIAAGRTRRVALADQRCRGLPGYIVISPMGMTASGSRPGAKLGSNTKATA